MKKIASLFLILFLYCQAFSQPLSVSLAGSGICTGDTLFLTSNHNPAQIIWELNGIVVNPVDAYWHANATTVAGNGIFGSGGAQLDTPGGIFVDKSGYIYIADEKNNRVQQWAAGANVGITVAGSTTAGTDSTKLSSPADVWVDTSGNVYIADAGNNRVQKWAPFAIHGTTVAGGNGAGNAANQLSNPQGVFVDTFGNVYVSDAANSRVQKWTPGATSGTTVAGGNGAGSAANQLSNPAGLYVDKTGNIYIADQGNNRIQKWAVSAITGTTVAGGNGAGANSNQLNSPSDVYVDGNSTAYITDKTNSRIQEWQTGASTGYTIAGGNGNGSAPNQFYYPTSIILDSEGVMYVSDRYNHRVQKFVTNTDTTLYVPLPGNYKAVVYTFTGKIDSTGIDTIHTKTRPDITVTPHPGTVVAGGTTVNYTTVATWGGLSPTYHWYLNGAAVGTNAATYSNSSLQNGDIVACVMISDAVCPYPDSVFHAVQETIIPADTISGTTNCVGSVLTVNSNIPGDKIVWKNNGNVVQTQIGGWQKNGTTVASNPGIYWQPIGLFVDNMGNMYVADQQYDQVTKWAPGATSGVVVASGYVFYDVFLDGLGNMYTADESSVMKWAPGASNGVLVAGGNGFGPASNQLNINSIFVDDKGAIYVTDFGFHKVMKWLPGADTGIVVAGGNGQGSAANQFNYPGGIYVDTAGNMYVSDIFGCRVQKWAPGATSGTTVAGGNGCDTGANQLYEPDGIYVDRKGYLFIADQVNHRVQLWTPGATTGITVAGGNYQSASSASQLSIVTDVFLDVSGNLYVTDVNYNYRVQKFSDSIINTYTTTAAGIYTAELTSARNAKGVSPPDSIYANVAPTAHISVSPGTSIGTGQNATFSVTTTNGGPAITYQWRKNGVNIPGATGSTYSTTTLANGDIITLSVNSHSPCASTDTAASNQLTMNVTTGVTNVSPGAEQNIIYPNPNDGNFSIQFAPSLYKASGELQIEVLDMNGKSMYSNKLVANTTTCNIHLNIAAGVYFVQFTDMSGQRSTQLMVKKD